MSTTATGYRKLSIVIPAFNSAGWITQCLEHLSAALKHAQISDSEVIVVDDGSTDGTGQEAQRFPGLPIQLVSQENQGRFLARENGLAKCSGSHVLFLDTRVFLAETSLTFVLPFLNEANSSLWTAHVEANTTGNPIARFWRAIESIFWRRYMKNPTTTSFGLEDFDYYPKGTTALIAPAGLIREAITAFRPTVTDWRKVNDDTALLRYAAERTRINISPQYACTYNARTNLKAFLHHANHRGSVLIDGYLRKGTRLNIPIWGVLLISTYPYRTLCVRLYSGYQQDRCHGVGWPLLAIRNFISLRYVLGTVAKSQPQKLAHGILHGPRQFSLKLNTHFFPRLSCNLWGQTNFSIEEFN